MTNLKTIRKIRPDAPRIITLCGAPESGKTRVQIILNQLYGAIAIDDGAIIRRGVMAMYNLTSDDVSTQEGKRRIIEIPGDRPVIVRDLLGRLGNHLEAMHGPAFIPMWSLKEARELYGDEKPLSFGSVRRDQAKYYKEKEKSICLEIWRKGATITREFDKYDKSLIDNSIENPWEDGCDPIMADIGLREKIIKIMDPIMT